MSADILVRLREQHVGIVPLAMLEEAAVEIEKLRLAQFPTWYCGCGHTNGVNLATCAACTRRPNGEPTGEYPR